MEAQRSETEEPAIADAGLRLELCSISKAFGGVRALDEVSFSLREGEVHGLVGENGAGKSTLMKILAGVHTRYDGQVRLHGKAVRLASPKSAKAHGIGMTYQELSSVGALSVAENLCLGAEPATRMGLVDWRRMYSLGQDHLAQMGVEIDVRSPVEDLPLGLQQIVEIARVTHSGADLLIMDEPTSALSSAEVQRLFAIIRGLKAEGKSIIFISHFLDDVLSICDRVTVLRNGRNVATRDSAGLAKHDLVRHILGTEAHTIEEGYEGAMTLHSQQDAPPALAVRGMSLGQRVRDVSFDLRRGEILGLYGPMGAGHTDVAECLYGLQHASSGEAVLDERPLTRHSPSRAKRRGMGYVSPDRKASLFLDAEIFKNISVVFLRHLVPFVFRTTKEIGLANTMIERLGVRAPSSLRPLRELSGGNQQKVAFARWLTHPIQLLILNEPTRGMDVGAKEEVMRLVKELQTTGVAVLLVTSEPEVAIMHSNRILAFSRGRIVAEFANQTVTKDQLMRCT